MTEPLKAYDALPESDRTLVDKAASIEAAKVTIFNIDASSHSDTGTNAAKSMETAFQQAQERIAGNKDHVDAIRGKGLEALQQEFDKAQESVRSKQEQLQARVTAYDAVSAFLSEKNGEISTKHREALEKRNFTYREFDIPPL